MANHRETIVTLTCPECGGEFRSLRWEFPDGGFAYSSEHECPSCNRDRWLSVFAGHGWGSLARECAERMAAIDPDFRFGQVKSKYGTLRLYHSASPFADRSAFDQLSAIEEEAYERSATICQVCGDAGTTQSDGGWIVVACDTHRR